MLKNRVRGEQFVGVPITRPPKYKRGRERERGDHQMEVHLRGQLLNYILGDHPNTYGDKHTSKKI